MTIRLNGNPYQIGCGAGEEAHVSKLGDEVESKVSSIDRKTRRISLSIKADTF